MSRENKQEVRGKKTVLLEDIHFTKSQFWVKNSAFTSKRMCPLEIATIMMGLFSFEDGTTISHLTSEKDQMEAFSRRFGITVIKKTQTAPRLT